MSQEKINIFYSILFNLTTSYSSYFGGKKGISRNKTSFFLLMIALMEKLFMTPFSDTELIQGQIDQFKLTLWSLETVGFTLAEKWIAGLLVIKLPEAYSMQKAILSSLPEKQTNVNDIIDQILADEAHHIRSSREEVTVFFANATKKGNPKANSRD